MTREEAIKELNTFKIGAKSELGKNALDMAIKALSRSENPNKWIVTDVLDKIRAEIEEEYDNCYICEWYEDYDYEENDISEFQRVGSVSDILEIIDKYKAESEEIV